MTRARAIELLKGIQFCCDFDDCTNSWDCDECVDAFNMAIEALEQEPTAEYSSDVISRQAAIDAVHSYFKDKLDGLPTEETEEGYEVVCDMDKIDAFLSDNKYLSKRIENLPSAQPFTSEQIQTMQELESAQIEKAYELGKEDRPNSEWLETEHSTNENGFKRWVEITCPLCGHKPVYENLDDMNFCPNCGADMRGGPTLTPEEFAEKMAGIAENGDEERKHVAADSIMCELLKSLGFGEGVGIFEDMDKWYS